MLGGREAELLVLDSVSSGASDDLKRASELAIEMVGSLGFSETFGLLSVGGIPDKLLGPDIQAAVLREARTLLEQAQETCRTLLRAQRQRLDAMARALLTREVLQGDELKQMLGDVGEGRKATAPTPAQIAAAPVLELAFSRRPDPASPSAPA
jgi:cell division protease FtsH